MRVVTGSSSVIDNAEGKQKIVVELYDKFFRNAFPKMTERLGIVYTPVHEDRTASTHGHTEPPHAGVKRHRCPLKGCWE